MAAQIILSLSILVGLHEAGHLLAAKAFGMRVEKYSIGFPPKIWGFQYGERKTPGIDGASRRTGWRRIRPDARQNV